MKKRLDISIGQFSSAGKKPINQDFHGALVPDGPALSAKGVAVAIADGISSSDVSQVASETAVKGFLQDYYCTSDSWSVKKSAQTVLNATNSWLYAQTANGPNRFNKDKGYICTFSALVFKSNTAHLLHCGDSRIYRLVDQNLEQLTSDHRRVVSEETAYLTRALGIHDHLEIDYSTIPLSEGDIFILATDGVYEFVNHKSIARMVRQGLDDLEQTAQDLIDQALEAGSDDNLTLQIVRINKLPEKQFDELHQHVSMLAPAPQLRARMHFDGYDILREIYISSRSHVFLAKDAETDALVVIKTPSVEMRDNQDYLEHFLMEEWIAKRVNSAHVLKAIEPGFKRNYLYLVTEYVDGITLAQWMVDNPSPPITQVREIIEQVARGLQAFHRQEMVHQDLRPNNVMIDSDGTVKIIDFGATKVAGVSEIKPINEGIVGTAQYTAPEYFVGKEGTNRSDIFSLGVMCYQMLSGQLPYGVEVAKTRDQRSQNRLNYQSLLNVDKAIPAWVDGAIGKATHINPEKRYAEISEFIYDLRHPNQDYTSKASKPLIERNPVLFWQCISLGLLGVILFQQFY